jgi:hypothetical protein
LSLPNEFDKLLRTLLGSAGVGTTSGQTAEVQAVIQQLRGQLIAQGLVFVPLINQEQKMRFIDSRGLHNSRTTYGVVGDDGHDISLFAFA